MQWRSPTVLHQPTGASHVQMAHLLSNTCCSRRRYTHRQWSSPASAAVGHTAQQQCQQLTAVLPAQGALPAAHCIRSCCQVLPCLHPMLQLCWWHCGCQALLALWWCALLSLKLPCSNLDSVLVKLWASPAWWRQHWDQLLPGCIESIAQFVPSRLQQSLRCRP